MVEAWLGRRSWSRDAKESNAYQNISFRNSLVDSATSIMYNMNTSLLTVPAAGAEGTSTGVTPRTPEILNSLMAMTNPFDMTRSGYPRVASSPPSDTASSSSSPPSLQATRSQLIKEGLKLTIQTKRRAHCSGGGEGGSSPPSEGMAALTTQAKVEDSGMDSGRGENSNDGLTPEDEERRKRRRERNKIAATKCRLKKRERTVNLVQESEILEIQNHDLKSQIKELETQRKKLFDMLAGHRPSCSKQNTYASTSCSAAVSTSSYQEQQYHHRCNNNNTSIESTSSSYSYTSAGPSTSYHKVSCESAVAYHRNSGTSSGGAASVYENGSFQRNTYIQQGAGVSNSVATSRADNITAYQQHHAADTNYMRNSASDSTVYTTLSSGSGSTSAGGSGSPIMFLGSPSTPQYNRPSSLGLNTASSSDYESNTEIVDSPSIPPSNYHHFDEDGAYTAGFPTSSCIS